LVLEDVFLCVSGGCHNVCGPPDCGWLIPRSTTNFHEPSACFFQTVTKSPNPDRFSSLLSALNSHGPVVKPKSPDADMPANAGCHASNGFLSDGGTGCSCIHCLPFTAPGRNNKPSSAMNARNASRAVFSSAIFENDCSVFTISCNADCPSADIATTKQITITKMYFISLPHP